MNLLKKLFTREQKPIDIPVKKDPENTRLNYLLEIWSQHPSEENYMAVLDEILNGNSFLALPSVNDHQTDGWIIAQPGDTLKLSSIFDLDGLKVLGAFSSAKHLLEWSQKPTQYVSIAASAITQICEEMNIGRVVINSGQKTMFVLERNTGMTSRVIQEETPVQVGTPAHPLDQHIIEKLVNNFQKIDTIEEAYQYLQKMNNEISLVLGIKMSVVSDNSRAALKQAVSNALEGEKLKNPLDIMVLETDEWLQTVKGVEHSLFYKR